MVAQRILAMRQSGTSGTGVFAHSPTSASRLALHFVVARREQARAVQWARLLRYSWL